MAATPLFIANLKNCAAQLVNADGTTLVLLLTPGASGSRLKSLVCSSDDTVDRVVQLWVTIGATDYLLGEATILDGSGSNGVDKGYEVLNNIDFPFLQADGAGVQFLDLAAGSLLKVKVKTAVTAAKKLQFFGEYGDL